MSNKLKALSKVVQHRFRGMFDPTAWVLLAISLLPLWFVDPAAAKTLAEWTSFALAFGGVTIMISRVVFPMIALQDMIEQAVSGNAAAGLIVVAVSLFMTGVFYSLIIWALAMRPT